MKKKPGRPPEYTEPTTTIAFRVPKSKIPEVKQFVKNYLNNLKIKKNDTNS